VEIRSGRDLPLPDVGPAQVADVIARA
jgi:hypothetical protein